MVAPNLVTSSADLAAGSSEDPHDRTNEHEHHAEKPHGIGVADVVVGEGDIYNSGAAVPRDQARLAVDEIEVKLRRFLDDTFRSKLGKDYWKRAVPGDVQAKIKERITEGNRSKIVVRIEDTLIRFQYADLMDLQKIVDKNWELFENTFGSRDALRSHFLALKNYRNPLGHARDIDIVEQKQGEAAIVWFRRAVNMPIEDPVADVEPEMATGRA